MVTVMGAISREGRAVAKHVPVEIEEIAGGWWTGTFEASAEVGSEMGRSGSFTLHLFDGREGEFVPAREAGKELGNAVVMVRGLGPLKKKEHTCGPGCSH